MALKLNGKPVSEYLSKKAPTPAIDRLIKFLESQSDDEVFTVRDIISRKICGRFSLMQNIPIFDFYKTTIPAGNGGKFCVFGNPRAILAAKKWAKKELGETV